VNLTGRIYTDSNGESFIRTRLCTTVDPDAKVSPVFMKNKSLGGGALGHQAGVEGSEGVNNVGMYVRTSGKVVSVDGGFFNIDDGSGNPVRATRTKVMNVGDYVTVTGAVSLRSNEGKRFVELLTTEYAVIREAPKPEQPEMPQGMPGMGGMPGMM
ncbi:MAG: hypothetical protein J6X53_06470, partial [Abditibacteriota bacterium]|nr:hypothetical protein [Abditibacteriota bacterium]